MSTLQKILQSNNKTELWNNIVNPIKNNRVQFTYLLGLIIYVIITIIIFSKNPYDIITGNNQGFSIFLALFGGFLLVMMYIFYANKKDEIENNNQITALSYLIQIFSFIGGIGLIIGVIYLLVKMGYYFNNVSYMLIYIVNWLIFIGLLTMGVKYFQLDEKSSSGESKPSWIRFIIQLITYIPCLVLTFIDYIKHQYAITTRPIVMLFIAEIVFVIIYFVLPIVIKEIVTHNANQLLKNPINLNYENTLGSFGSVNYIKDKFQYHYAVSGWFYINSFPPETNANYSEYTSILNIGDKPNITFNVAKNTLKIKMNTEGHNERELFKTSDFKMQKWNNIVINYDGNTLDIFINNELVSTTNGVIPYNSNTMITTGTTNGISGGACNIMYFNNSISRSKIQWLYDSVKYLNPPII
jgi:hypothetical protein